MSLDVNLEIHLKVGMNLNCGCKQGCEQHRKGDSLYLSIQLQPSSLSFSTFATTSVDSSPSG